eukprot:UN10185
MTSESLEIIKWRKIALRKSAVSNHTTLFPPTMHGVLCPHITTQSTFTIHIIAVYDRNTSSNTFINVK